MTRFRHPCRNDAAYSKALRHNENCWEYIVIDPLEGYVQRFLLQGDGLYGASEVFGSLELLPLSSLPGVELPLWDLFGIELPDADTASTE